MLSACAVGPDFMRPDSPAASASRFNNSFDRIGQSSDMNLWWERLGDPVLNDYADKLLRQNLSLQEAGERVIQSRERVTSARGDYAPTLSATTSDTRSFTPTGGQRSYSTAYNASLSASWQIDLFGRIQRSVESANARYEAAQYDYEALTHSLIAQLLNRRVAIAVNKELLDLAQKNYINRKKIYKLVKKRYELGARGTTLSDVYLAEDNYESVYAEVYQFERALMDEIYRLDILLGEMPGTTDPLNSGFSLVAPPMDVAACIPARLLDRRPDLKASELRAKAANANIGVAVADLYPSVNLSGSLGFSGASTNSLFSAQQMAGSLLGSITQRIFEGGKLRSNIALRESEARELALAYSDDVLNAVYEVETRLKSDRDLTDELRSAEKSLKALRNAEELSQKRYIGGIITLEQFLDVQQRRYTAEQSYRRKQQEKWDTRTALYLALGGDWLGDKSANTDKTQTRLCQ